MGRFGQFLVSEGQLRPDQLEKAMEMQQLVGGRLGTNLLELGVLREEVVLEALGKFRRSRTASAHQLRRIPHETLRLVPPVIARRHFFVPIEHRGHTLTLAARDPVDPLVEDELGHLTSCLVRTTIALELRIHEALGRYYQLPQPTRLSGLVRRLDAVAGRAESGTEPAPAAPAPAANGSPPPPARVRIPTRKPRAATQSPAPAKTEEEVRSDTNEPAIQYIELDDNTKQRIYTADAEGQTPQRRLDLMTDELQSASIRDEIGDVLLGYSRAYLKRRLLLFRRTDRIVGWRGEGSGVGSDKVRAIDLPTEEPSVFLSLQQGTEFWLGPLTPLPAHQSLLDALGEPVPKDCLVLPITLRGRIVTFFYGDNGNAGVSGAPVAELKRLARKAGVAFEVCILKNKIRTL